MGSLTKFAGSSNFLKKEDVPRPIQATIASTGEHTFEGKQPQLVLTFHEQIKPLVANATNVKLLSAMFQVSEEEQLIGRRIEIFVDPAVTMMGQIVGGLRVRLPSGGQPVQTQPVQTQPVYQQPSTQQAQQPAASNDTPPWA